jgi:hypothetical protein
VTSFDLDEYRRELEASMFEAARARLESRGWTLEPGAPQHWRARKVLDNGTPHEIVLNSFAKIEQAAADCDSLQASIAEKAREEARRRKQVDIQAELDEELRRKTRAAQERLRDEIALRDHA